MRAFLAYSSFLLTVALTLARPRVGPRLRFGPLVAALLGVAMIVAGGVITGTEFAYAAGILWRPLVTITSIMVMTAAAENMGVLRWLAGQIAGAAHPRASRTFTYAFLGSALTATVLNNDSAVILLTPLTVRLVMDLYPDQPRLIEPFAFAVFLAPGVAPFITSNPMNMIVASFARLDFNHYALRMAPISVLSILVTYCVLRLFYRRVLDVPSLLPSPGIRPRLSPQARVVTAIVLAVLIAYPVVSYLGGQIWMVAATAALICSSIAVGSGVSPARLRQGIPVQVLGLLTGLFLIALGMRNVGAILQLSSWYRSFIHSGHQLSVVGTTSLLGSALVNNHPMAILNMLALQSEGAMDPRPYLAALIGGDLGPRLLPLGSLAGLLWTDGLRRAGIHIPVHRFVQLGILTGIPAFLASLLLLLALS